MTRTHRFVLPFLGAAALAGLAAEARPTRRRPAVTRQVAPETPPPEPTHVAVGAHELANTLRRMRIYVARAADGSRAFGDLGAGEQLWFVLPSCRARDNLEARDACPIERLELEPQGAGGVRAGRLTTVLDGEVPRRVQAFVVAPGTRLVRVRLVNQRGEVRFDTLFEVERLRELAPPDGVARPDGTFALDFARYPAR